MNVIALTVFIGFILVTFFVCFFLFQSQDKFHGSLEHDSLLPLESEKPVSPSAPSETPSTPSTSSQH